jgi:iron complex transport system permease protein
VAFVGLAAPHLVRSIVNTSSQRLVLLSSLMGGVLMMAADTLARFIEAKTDEDAQALLRLGVRLTRKV